MKNKRYHHKYYVRRNVFLSLLFAAVIFGLIGTGSIVKANSAGDTTTGRVKVYSSIYIQEGDTLWTIAEEYATEEYASLDQFVSETKQLNHLSSTSLHAGCHIMIPHYVEPTK